MNRVLIIACEEWRYWLRSKLVPSVAALFALMLITVSVINGTHMAAQSNERAHDQAHAEQTFLDQPDRHPHRMVHYGHYVFRTPAPLSSFDPGLDSMTGQSVFLEGHRQNTAMFSNAGASANLGGLSWLTPALIYQLFGPLLIILLGHTVITREREAKTLAPLLAQGISGKTLVLGKALALLAFVALLLLPLLASTLFAVLKVGGGDEGLFSSLLAVVVLVVVYFVYLAIWCALTLLVSAWLQTGSAVIATLFTLWLTLSLVVPPGAVNVAAWMAPLAGKIETDFRMMSESSDLSDGHNVSHSDQEQLQSRLFNEQGVNQLEDLDVNIRGLLAQNAEQQLTETMNLYADQRMTGEQRQANIVANHGWLSPMLAVANASRAISGTDLEHYHRFLRQAEELRYEFVQGLNEVHALKLDYETDINRSVDEDASQRTRMDASNWQLLEAFQFQPESSSTRLANAAMPIAMLCIWIILLSGILLRVAGRLRP